MIIELNKHTVKISSNKNFGFTFAIIFFLVSLYFYQKSINLFIILISISLFLLIITFYFPSILKYPNILWSRFGIILGLIVSPIVLFLLFYFIVTPIGLIMKILRKDTLKIIKEKKYNSSWVHKETHSNMEDQF